jgi:hypothetical protein
MTVFANTIFTGRQIALPALLLSIVLWAALPVSASGEDHREKLAALQKQSIINKVAQVLIDNYVDQDKATEMADMIYSSLENGDYENIEYLPEFCDRITFDLRKVSNDLHLKVSPIQEQSHPDGTSNPQDDHERTLQRLREQNFGFNKVEFLDGNIGFIDLRLFVDAHYAGPTAIAAMNFVAYCDALIIDLRENTGGQPNMIQLICSYLFDTPTYLGGFYMRAGDSVLQFWTQPYVNGPRLTGVPVYVLVSRKTLSAAEGFAYVLQDLQRITVVGETTAGGANPQMPHFFPEESVVVNVPFGKAVSPISKDNWEGRGVAPDIPVPAGEALEVAQIKALRRMLEREDDEKKKRVIQTIIREVEAGREAR